MTEEEYKKLSNKNIIRHRRLDWVLNLLEEGDPYVHGGHYLVKNERMKIMGASYKEWDIIT